MREERCRGGRPENGARMGFKLSCISDNNAGEKGGKERREPQLYLHAAKLAGQLSILDSLFDKGWELQLIQVRVLQY